ncbi:MAG: nuclear transport factor 2 family protein [Cyanothece sp. SIO1E1]|nr:nuclear transport factor 2 family protein [Cyanothece sp. SIO1E1]
MHTRITSVPVFCLLIFWFLTPQAVSAQVNDTTSIKKVIEKYIVGWRTGDATLLKEAFDLEAGVVFWVDRKGESEQLKSMKLSALTDRGKKQPDYGIGYTIQNLQIIDDQLAIAMVKIPLKESYYIDCLELQKINEVWKIVLKSYVYFPKKTASQD